MSNGLILRKRVDALSGSELAALRNAYAKMQGILDNRGYNYWAGFTAYRSIIVGTTRAVFPGPDLR